MKTALIIHGHFYQPPREDPSTAIAPAQTSAKPYLNWNEAVYRTCYYPNSCSRYLTPKGKIDAIYNNYSTVSSDFGPTLLNWIDSEHPDFIEKLREADRISIQKFGHSNFVAQTYNHTILPLDTDQNKEIQVKWALEDYRTRFGHESEGFWCAECAIDKATIDVLANNGIKFVILSPWQATEINGISLNGKSAPYDRAFIIKGNSKELSAFFYNPDFASGISFGHLLTDADKLYQNLIEYKKKNNNPKLISWATDGEIYGHHEAFGDMALAALIKKVQDGDQFYFTNYAQYLELYPPVEYAILSSGEDGKGSSWSCSHGVKRWYTDCGCHTGGSEHWNQKWRTPLRDVLNALEKKARLVFDQNIKAILGHNQDSNALLTSYIKVLTNQVSIYKFVSSLQTDSGKHISSEQAQTVALLLDAMKNVLFSFTSCGWFFNDISGLEPTQNIGYAVYAAKNLQRFTNENILPALIKDLKDAKSNIPSKGNGETIAQFWNSLIPPFARACGYFAMNRRLASEKDYTNFFGCFHLKTITDKYMAIINSKTLEHFRLSYKTEILKSGVFAIRVRNLKTGYSYEYDSSQIALRSLMDFSDWVDGYNSKFCSANTFSEICQNIEHFMILSSAAKYEIKNNIIAENISICIRYLKAQMLLSDNLKSEEIIDRTSKLAAFVSKAGNQSDKETMTAVFNKQLDYYANRLSNNKMTDHNTSMLLSMLQIFRSNMFNVDITSLQNAIWPYLTKSKKTDIDAPILKQLALDLNFNIQA